MKAAVYREFKGPVVLEEVEDPAPPDQGVVIRVEATGLCLSDWHGWQGNDPDITLPHVPGHELAGVVEAAGKDVTLWKPGDRVTLPFVCGCGTCPPCASGNQQVCDRQFQPGFTHWGSFARYVAVDRADGNLVSLPAEMEFSTAASLGCRFATSFRAMVDQARVTAGEWVAVHGCGGVGLSAVMIARALGANVVAVDIRDDSLELARTLGASAGVNASEVKDVVEAVRELTGGGAHVSLDALGSRETCFNSVACLRKQGRHVQVGLMVGEYAEPAVPMGRVMSWELELYGSHGMQAHRYDAMLAMIEKGMLEPQKLIERTIPLEEVTEALPAMDRFERTGVTVIVPGDEG